MDTGKVLLCLTTSIFFHTVIFFLDLLATIPVPWDKIQMHEVARMSSGIEEPPHNKGENELLSKRKVSHNKPKKFRWSHIIV